MIKKLYSPKQTEARKKWMNYAHMELKKVMKNINRTFLIYHIQIYIGFDNAGVWRGFGAECRNSVGMVVFWRFWGWAGLTKKPGDVIGFAGLGFGDIWGKWRFGDGFCKWRNYHRREFDAT